MSIYFLRNLLNFVGTIFQFYAHQKKIIPIIIAQQNSHQYIRIYGYFCRRIAINLLIWSEQRKVIRSSLQKFPHSQNTASSNDGICIQNPMHIYSHPSFFNGIYRITRRENEKASICMLSWYKSCNVSSWNSNFAEQQVLFNSNMVTKYLISSLF